MLISWLSWAVASLALVEPTSASPSQIEREQQAPITIPVVNNERTRVPGESPAYHCSDPSDDIFRIERLDFIPTNPRIGFYQSIRLVGYFLTATGDVPMMNITGKINGRPELEPLYYSPLCDIDVFQYVEMPVLGSDDLAPPSLHRSCPLSIQKGYAIVSSPPMPLHQDMVPQGRWDIRAEAQTQDGRRIFCVEGSFDVTT